MSSRTVKPLVAVKTPPASASASATRPPTSSRTAKPLVAVKTPTGNGLAFLNWNAENLTSGTKELALLDLLVVNNVDVAVVTEAEVPTYRGAFDVAGYVAFLPAVPNGDKYRVIVYVRCDVALATDARLATDIMSEGLQAVWVRLDARPKGPGGRAATPAMIVGGLYRQWSRWSPSGLDRSAAMQWEQLTKFLQQVDKAARSSWAVIVLRDVNLDALRTCNGTYKLRPMLTELRAGMARAGLTYHKTGATYVSHGHLKMSAAALAASRPTALAPLALATPAPATRPPTSSRTSKPLAAVKSPPSASGPTAAATPLAPSLTRKPLVAVKTLPSASAPPMAAAAKASRYSALDHVYSAGVLLNVQVLPSAATDHMPLLAALGTESGSSLENRVIDRRNFKAIYSVSLCAALERHCVWEDVYAIKGADDSLAFIMGGINAALDDVAPVKSISVKAGAPLYLAADIRAAMKARDSVARKGLKYKHLRNEANRLVKRDHVRSNMSRLAKSRGDPRVVWQIAKSAMGQDSA
jgi:hypothetical protein